MSAPVLGDQGTRERVTLLTGEEVGEGASSPDVGGGSDPGDLLPVFRRVARTAGGPRRPVAVIVVGMAGSGKTTFTTALNDHLDAIDEERDAARRKEGGGDRSTASDAGEGGADAGGDAGGDGDGDDGPSCGYYLNLDPATTHMPFGANIDIRDTVNYREVMSQYGLGPNGAIMTCLNLFATKFDQVLSLLEARSEEADYVLVDTPGQIEAFTWSASGQIVGESLATSFPTVLAYVVDTPRCASPATFMSNMLYASSMYYRTRLPLVVVFNKSDVLSPEFATEWMEDFEKFQEALDERSEGSGYYGSLVRSMSLVLDEFYSGLHHVGVSSKTGEGVKEFFEKVDDAAREFEEEYLPDLKCRMEEQKAKREAVARVGLARLHRDVELDAKTNR